MDARPPHGQGEAEEALREQAARLRATEEALLWSERRFRALAQQASDVVIVLSAEGRITYLSPSARNLFGYSEADLREADGASLVHPEDLPVTLEAFARITEPGASTRAEYRVSTPDGRWRHVETVFTNLLHEPAVAGFVLNSRDVTERAEAEAILLRNQEQLVIAQRLSMTGSWDQDLVTGAMGWSKQLAVILGLGEAAPASPEAMLAAVHPSDRPLAEAAQARALTDKGPQDYRFRVVRQDGSVATMVATVEATFDDTGAPVRLTGAVQDVSDRLALESELQRQSFYDGLTGLANRALFLDRLGHAALRLDREGGAFSILLVDLEAFRAINDSLGHAAGDDLLCSIARRLAAILRPSDTPARLGGDEFALLVEGAGRAAAEVVAQRALAAIARPVHVGGQQVFVRASVGIRTAEAGAAAPDLLRDAQLALHAAKLDVRSRGRRGRYRLFDPGMHAAARRRLELRRELERAVAGEEFELRYQPVVRLDTGALVGFEALVRWHHPTTGIISPVEFIPVAEETGLIVPIGGWVMEEAIAWVQALNATLEHPLDLSVNLSPQQLADPTLVALVEEAVASAGMPADRLVVEITESVLVEEGAVPVLGDLRTRGVRVAVDDFGTGYSSLSYLRHLPIDVLKIDRSFVAAITRTAEDAAVARTVVGLAEALNLSTVAEGVEAPDQASALLALGCTFGQGYLYARPMTPADAEDFARTPLRLGSDEIGPNQK